MNTQWFNKERKKYAVYTRSYKQACISLPLLHALSHTQYDMFVWQAIHIGIIKLSGVVATRNNESSRSVEHSLFTLTASYKPSDSRTTIFHLQTERTPTELAGGGERYIRRETGMLKAVGGAEKEHSIA